MIGGVGRPRVMMLDLDGVVIRHTGVQKRVANRVVEYVASELNLPIEDAVRINKLLYKTYGHTLPGLQHVYRVDKSHEDFANFVYTDEIVGLLYQEKEAIWSQSKSLRNILEKNKRAGVETYIFSNAPHKWCSNSLHILDLFEYIPQNNIISSEHNIFEKRLFKPNVKLYQNLISFIQKSKHTLQPLIYFVDDSFSNIQPVVSNPLWVPIWLASEKEPSVQSRSMMTIRKLKQLDILY